LPQSEKGELSLEILYLLSSSKQKCKYETLFRTSSAAAASKQEASKTATDSRFNQNKSKRMLSTTRGIISASSYALNRLN